MQNRIFVLCIGLSSITSSLACAEDSNTFLLSPPFQTAEMEPSFGDFGGVGLMQMPTGRMAKEGTFSFGYNKSPEYQFYSLSMQLMPWFETTLRYTQVEDVLYNPDKNFSGNTRYADKGMDAKIRLWQESQWLPEVSVGLRDIGGTGLFDGEFIAGTKRFYSNNLGQLDITLGLGFGYLGQRGDIGNPLCSVKVSFCERMATNGETGTVDYTRWFTGRTSLFGGIEYQTPYDPLRLKIEYDGNDYSEDFPATRGGVNMTPKTPWNFGAIYEVSDGFNLRLSYERGTTLTLGFTLSTNFDTMNSPWIDDPLPPLSTSQPTTLDGVAWKKLDKELNTIAGYKTEKVYHQDQTITLVTQQHRYRDRELAAERAAAVLNNHLPNDIQSYKIIEERQHIPVKTTEISAAAYRDVATVNYINPSIKDALTELPPEEINEKPLKDYYNPLSYGFTPHLSQSIGNPESFYLYSLSLDGGASYWLTQNLKLSGSISLNAIDNYDKIRFNIIQDGTNNYRVRKLLRAYIRDNDTYMRSLQLTWFQKYSQNWYQQVYGGYLETMFAGVGTEILYRRPNSNWAIGADYNIIAQRDPDTAFGIFANDDDYRSDAKVLSRGTTGHLSLYYQPEWSFLEGTQFQVDIGKFLATDVGVRFDVSKQFNSGVIVGAFASKTNMSAETFGEGSFTKGFYLSIPFDTVSLKPTNSRGNFAWQPLTRDGGQMLGKQNSLYSITDMVSPWYQRPNKNSQTIITP